MSFEIGEVIKKPLGKTLFKVRRIIINQRWGKAIEVENLTNGKIYSTGYERWVKYEPFKPKMNSEEIKYSFIHGV